MQFVLVLVLVVGALRVGGSVFWVVFGAVWLIVSAVCVGLVGANWLSFSAVGVFVQFVLFLLQFRFVLTALLLAFGATCIVLGAV